MADRYDGGPAFPQHDLSGYGMGPAETNNGGMTLLDWFAGKALHYTLDRARDQQSSGGRRFETKEDEIEAACQWAYDIAEAMVEEKAKRNG